MVQRVVVRKVDDVDGAEAAETVTFGLDGKAFEIDLTAEHAAELRAVLAPFVTAGRRVGGPGRAASTRAVKTARSYDPAAVRAWAASRKIDVPRLGRIPAGIVEQFHAAGY